MVLLDLNFMSIPVKELSKANKEIRNIANSIFKDITKDSRCGSLAVRYGLNEHSIRRELCRVLVNRLYVRSMMKNPILK